MTVRNLPILLTFCFFVFHSDTYSSDYSQPTPTPHSIRSISCVGILLHCCPDVENKISAILLIINQYIANLRCTRLQTASGFCCTPRCHVAIHSEIVTYVSRIAGFSQIMDFVPRRPLNRCVNRYQGDRKVHLFRCSQQYLAMAIAQLNRRSSLRDLVVYLWV